MTFMTKRYQQIDTLRFISILFIIMYHYQKFRYSGGFLGVNIFLVISGILLGIKLEKNYFNGEEVTLFYNLKRTIQKLIPPVLFVIGLLSAVLLFFRHEFLTNWFMQTFSTVFFFNNWYQISQGASYFAEIIQPSLLTHLWYLSLYVQSIIVIQLLFKFVRPLFSRRHYFGYTLIGLSLLSLLTMVLLFEPGSDPTRVYYGTDTRLFSMLLGAGLVCINPLYRSTHGKDEIRPLLLQGGLLAIMVVMLFMIEDSSTFTYWGGMYLFDIVTALAVLSLLYYDTIIQRVLSFRATTILGRLSYPMYLWYYPVYIGLYNHAGQLPAFFLHIPVQLAIILGLSVGTYFLFDKKLGIVKFPPFTSLSLTTLKEDWLHASARRKITLSSYASLLLFFLISLGVSAMQSDEVAAGLEATYTQRHEDLLEQNQQRATTSEPTEEPEEAEETQEPEHIYTAENVEVTFFGDSTVLSGSEQFYDRFPLATVYGEVGLQLYNAMPQLNAMRQSGQLHDIIVFSLGANGGFSNDHLEQLINQLDDDTKIFLLTTHVSRPWAADVNAQFRQIAETHDNIYLMDWANNFSYEGYLYEPDGIHLNYDGISVWIDFIESQLLDTLNNGRVDNNSNA
ncbi:acyltransferase [Dolosigranulum pigrum]|uniref:Acyltransferase n=2 Tax=Dolosigranulum pigrum TaxID=29394 RepID=A0A516GIL9_9LACT|nr:acyltransferase [Dolosigranulum pigrum]